MPKIEVSGLTKIFGKHPADVLPLVAKGLTRDEIREKTRHLVAVNDISFSVEEGEVAVIIGLSGSGKSTLVRCLNRLIEPTAGSIRIDGEDITRLPKRQMRELRQRKFGMVFQQFALFPHFNVLRNAAYGLELQGVDKQERERRALDALDVVGLKDWAMSAPKNLSGGMQQRVGLARALALDPEVLLMDEAFSALDPLTRREMQEELVRLQHELHKTVIFISHDLDEALALGDKIIMMRDGRIVQQGTPEDILSNPADEHVAGFVRHADRGRVLTAGSIMEPVLAFGVLGPDGPYSLLRKMRNLNMSSLFILDSSHTLLGVINEEDVVGMKEAGTKDVTLAMNRDVTFATLDDQLTDLIHLVASLPYPLPVVDARNRLRGVIIRGTLLEALSGQPAQSGQNGQKGEAA